MALPPELVDEILTQLRDDKQTLLNCSLIAKSWAYPSQKLLHDWHLCFIPETYRTWQETASPTRMELLPRVRSLTYRNFDSLYPFPRDHLKSFHRLQQITLRNINLDIQSNIINYLPASQNTLSSLYLANVSIYSTALVDLINHFPNLRDLHLYQSYIHQARHTAPFFGSPRGKLCLTALTSVAVSTLLSCLLELELGYDELEIVNFGETAHFWLSPLIPPCRKTLACLKFSPLPGESQCYALCANFARII